MSRRAFLRSCAAALLIALPCAAAAAEAFSSERITVVTRGRGPDVILIPGLAASRGIWVPTAAAVPGFRYHLVQLSGFGGEPTRGNAGGRVVASVAGEIARYVRTLRRRGAMPRSPHIAGHSMGGTIAMMLASRYPDAAGPVMVVDMVPAPVSLFGTSASSAQPFARFLRAEVQGADRVRQALASVVGKFGAADWLATGSDARVVGRSLEELLVTDLTPELPRIRSPLTVVYACPDPTPLTRPAIERLYRRAYAPRAGTRLVAIERSGHTIMADQPTAFQGAFRAFLTAR
jgi:pimeloyl-ACP methyl ester carboxylesterase